jgi:hypothetical protein
MLEGVYVYRDSSHISLKFSEEMAAEWRDRLTQLGVKLPAIPGLNN